jgi:hypothetical protein
MARIVQRLRWTHPIGRSGHGFNSGFSDLPAMLSPPKKGTTMTLLQRTSQLPRRLRSALRIWLGIAALSLVMPESAVASIGLLAHSWFWAGVLPLVVMLPFLRQMWPAKPAVDARQQRNSSEFMRHTHSPVLKSVAGHLGA